MLSSPLEIEELVGLGKSVGACPYYASRAALKEAQLVVLPYTALLQESTRDSLGLNLSGAVISPPTTPPSHDPSTPPPMAPPRPPSHDPPPTPP